MLWNLLNKNPLKEDDEEINVQKNIYYPTKSNNKNTINKNINIYKYNQEHLD